MGVAWLVCGVGRGSPDREGSWMLVVDMVVKVSGGAHIPISEHIIK